MNPPYPSHIKETLKVRGGGTMLNAALSPPGRVCMEDGQRCEPFSCFMTCDGKCRKIVSSLKRKESRCGLEPIVSVNNNF